MEVYICDDQFNPDKTVDGYESCIWTERYSKAGDFELVTSDSAKNRNSIKEGLFARVDETDSIMQIQSINTKDGKLTAKGVDILEFLRQRFFRDTWLDNQGWYAEGLSVYQLINEILRTTVNPAANMISGQVLRADQGANEAISDFYISQEFPDGPNDEYPTQVPYNDVYTVITDLAAADALGLKLRKRVGGGMLFSMYRGVSRTRSQKLYDPIVLSPAIGNLTGLETLNSIANYKNVCWVWPSQITDQSQIVMASVDGGSSKTGFDRRTMSIVASDINPTDYPDPTLLQRILFISGLNALINNNYVRMVDGELVIPSKYKFGQDYNLGDILELQGVGSDPVMPARVTEYIRSQDATGASAYPTLSVTS